MKPFFLLVSFLIPVFLLGQGATKITSGLRIKTTGNCFVVVETLDLENDGTIQQSSGGTVVFSGNTTKEVKGNGVSEFYNILINKQTGSSLILYKNISTAGDFTLTEGDLELKPGYRLSVAGNAAFNDNNVVLNSDASGTSSFGVFGGTVTGAKNVNVNLYIPAGRKWRTVSVPLKGTINNTVFYHWQNNGGTAVPGTGALLWKPGGTFINGNGYSNGGSAANLLIYNSGFSSPANTKSAAPLFSASGAIPYLIFLTDSYQAIDGAGNIASGASATTLKSHGELFTGSLNRTGLGTGFHFLANPYPSAIDFSQLSRSSGIANKFWIWDPKLFGFGGYGGYVVTSNGESTPLGGSFNSNTTVIPHGAAFWIYSTGTNQSVGFTETAKTANDYSVFGRVTGENQRLRINLYDEGKGHLYDGVLTVYNQHYSNEIDADDALKFTIGDENISMKRNKEQLAIEFRSQIQSSDTIFLMLHGMKPQNYMLTIQAEHLKVPLGMEAVLQDRFLNTEHKLIEEGIAEIPFQVTTNALSSNDRYRIIFRPSVVTSIEDFETGSGIRVFPNPVSISDKFNLFLENIPAGNYYINIISLNGALVQRSKFKHIGGMSVQEVQLPAKMMKGVYMIEVLSENGYKKRAQFSLQ